MTEGGGLLESQVEMFLHVGLPLAPLLFLCGVGPSRAPEFSGADAGAVPWKASGADAGGLLSQAWERKLLPLAKAEQATALVLPDQLSVWTFS